MSRRNTYLISFPKQKHSSTWKVYTSRPRSITGQYTKSITHHVDTYGRNAGYSIDTSRQSTLSYDLATGRMIGMNATEGDFTWNYLANTNLKSKLTYPNGATVEWAYELKRNVLTSVTNSLRLSDSVINPQVISQYDYTNDAIGRRTAMSKSGIMMSETDIINYGYNARNEVISADATEDTDYLFNYAFDDIGNRITGENKAYTANALNQYTAIGTFPPTFDANGNQTVVQTTTGTWTVVYNAENRPVRWTQGETVITMAYDRMGRRISYEKIQGDIQSSHVKFLYNDYLCIQQLSMNAPWNVLKTFVWDPTEPIATRPLVFTEGEQTAFYMHDGNKNVTDVISSTSSSSDVTHYDYAPFGAVVRTVSADISTSNSSSITHNSELRSDNPFRFSSEYHDDDLGLVYYNYRHYNPTDGRWINRDPIEEQGGLNLYVMTLNELIMSVDVKGLSKIPRNTHIDVSGIPRDLATYEGKLKQALQNGANPKHIQNLRGMIKTLKRNKTQRGTVNMKTLTSFLKLGVAVGIFKTTTSVLNHIDYFSTRMEPSFFVHQPHEPCQDGKVPFLESLTQEIEYTENIVNGLLWGATGYIRFETFHMNKIIITYSCCCPDNQGEAQTSFKQEEEQIDSDETLGGFWSSSSVILHTEKFSMKTSCYD